MILNYVPDSLIRYFIRDFCKKRIEECNDGGVESEQNKWQKWVNEIKNSPIALNTEEANEQHYELPPEFFHYCLGRNLKYSSAMWDDKTDNLDEAEDKMLQTTMERAELKNGQRVLELGCGWGSLSFAMAKKFPESQFTLVSNSNSQRKDIYSRAIKENISNIEVITSDMNEFEAELNCYDRVVSVEMFEHMRNWDALLKKISSWLKADGKCFVHIFTHKKYGYAYEVKDKTDWMSKYFFTGGQMPSESQFSYFQDDLKLQTQWAVNGKNYALTSEWWLKNMDHNKDKILPIFKKTYGEDYKNWFQRWRIFYMSCAELFNFNRGNEWFVSHYLFQNRRIVA
jgi:cyclopropane-fatty-acyl-phospholipid synthase